MSDISDFLQSYNETLQQEIAGTNMPPELTERFSFTFDSCVIHRYVLSRTRTKKKKIKPERKGMDRID